MLSESDAEKILLKDGYTNIYVWQDGPNAYYPPHTHPTESAHIILFGELTLITEDNAQTLQAGERFDVPANLEHAAQIGRGGCTYIIGEK